MIVIGYEYAVNKIGKKKLYQKEKLINLGGELFFSEKEEYGILDKTNPHSIYDLMLYDFMPKYKSMTYKRLKFLFCESIKLFGILQEPWIQEKYNLISGTTRIIYNYSTNISEMSTMSKDNFHIHINTISILDFRTNGLIKKEFSIDNSIFEMSVLLYNELKNSGKDVYVSMKKQATSGGYYVSMAAKKIFANTETTTGSLGVIMSFVSAQKYLNDHGIKQETIRSGEQKAIGGLLEDLPESTRKIYQEQNKEAYDRFVKAIAQGRNMSEDEVRKLADGRTYTGTQAVENKLIDKIGTEEDLINFIKEDKKLFNPKVIELRPDKAAESLLSRFVKATMKSIISELNSEATSNQVERSYLG